MRDESRNKKGGWSNLPVRGASGGDSSLEMETVAQVSADAKRQGTAMCRTGEEAQTMQGAEFSK